MEKKVCLTNEEILKNPNNATLGELVRKKYWEIQDKLNQTNNNDTKTRKGVSK